MRLSCFNNGGICLKPSDMLTDLWLCSVPPMVSDFGKRVWLLIRIPTPALRQPFLCVRLLGQWHPSQVLLLGFGHDYFSYALQCWFLHHWQLKWLRCHFWISHNLLRVYFSFNVIKQSDKHLSWVYKGEVLCSGRSQFEERLLALTKASRTGQILSSWRLQNDEMFH